MSKFSLKKIGGVVVATAAGLFATASNAAVDTAAITDVATDVTSVGTAVFGILVLVVGIKLVRKAL